MKKESFEDHMPHPGSDDELCQMVKTERFGESNDESLSTFLRCEAFENRHGDLRRARAYSLAAQAIDAWLRRSGRGVR